MNAPWTKTFDGYFKPFTQAAPSGRPVRVVARLQRVTFGDGSRGFILKLGGADVPQVRRKTLAAATRAADAYLETL